MVAGAFACGRQPAQEFRVGPLLTHQEAQVPDGGGVVAAAGHDQGRRPDHRDRRSREPAQGCPPPLADGRRASSDISTATFTQPPSWPYAEGVGVPHGEDVTTDIWFDASER